LIRLTTGLLDSDGLPMAAQYTSPLGFTTKPAMVVQSITPENNGGTALNAPVTIVFSRDADSTSVTFNGAGDTTCSGTVQVSSDSNFQTCEPMKPPQISRVTPLGSTTFAFSPVGFYAASTRFKVRVKAAVTDLD